MPYSSRSPVVGRTPDVPSPIRMFPAGQDVYVAFCDALMQPHYLEVAGTLYVFMQDCLDVESIIGAIASVLRRLPTDSELYGCSIDEVIEASWVSQIVAIEPEASQLQQDQCPLSGGIFTSMASA